jgi:hypothetical protein
MALPIVVDQVLVGERDPRRAAAHQARDVMHHPLLHRPSLKEVAKRPASPLTFGTATTQGVQR